ncbi:MAG: hypothetical protein IJ186_02785 [Bacilli bacterium]|jgi:uncharacterized protein YaaQ|nr:hypothetical protein [Bacilli bacterium]
MKHLLFAVFENTDGTHELIHELAEKGINGTVLASTSLRHILHSIEEERTFITLRQLERQQFEDNTTFYTLIEEENLDNVLNIIRKGTNNFKDIKGGMFVLPVERYEGSF